MLDNLTMVESKLDARLHEIEGASTQLKETVLMDKNEYLGLSERMENLTVQLETEMKYSKSLSEELKALRKSLQNYESTLAQMKLKLNETPKEVVQVRPKSSKSTRVKSGTTSTVVLVFAIAICVGLGSAYLLSPDGMETFLQYLVFN